jgi:hypothetical protein
VTEEQQLPADALPEPPPPLTPADIAKIEQHAAFDAESLDRESMSFVRYDPQTGAVLESGQMGHGMILKQIEAGQSYLTTPELSRDEATAALTTHYVDISTPSPSLRAKTPFPGTLSGMEITGLPVPCRVGIQTPFTPAQGWWEAVWHDWDEPEIELSFENPGTYRVTVTSVQHLDGVFEVTGG